MNLQTAQEFFRHYAYNKHEAIRNSKDYGNRKDLIKEIESNRKEVAQNEDLFLVEDCLEDLKTFK